MKTRLSYLLLAILFFLSCQKSADDMEPATMKTSVTAIQGSIASVKSGNSLKLFFGHESFKRTEGTPVTEKRDLFNPDLKCYGPDFYLNILNGNSKETRVTSAEITIDGVLIAGPSDFSKNIIIITKELRNLTPESVLEVNLRSSPGSFIELWIEGTYNTVMPRFSGIGPLLQNSESPSLPLVSDNNIPGSWEPSAINTSATGTFTYTFTPDAGYCAETVKMDVEITNRISDIEGNSYKVVKIGNQFWMAENLKTKKYANGDEIETTIPFNLNITGQVNPKYQWAHGGIEDNANVYGRLYTFYTATDGRGVCPTGWHVPADREWSELSDFLIANGFGYLGSGTDIAKSIAAQSSWRTNTIPGNTGNDQASNNSSGFSALAAGYRNLTGSFGNIGTYARWWSSAATISYGLTFNTNSLTRVRVNNGNGYSIRCIQNK